MTLPNPRWFIPAVVIYTCIIAVSVAHCAEPAAILDAARREIGNGETAADNCGPDIRRYTGAQDGISWCAAFVSYIVRQAGYSIPQTFAARQWLKRGTVSTTPRPGDIIVFWRGSRSSWQGHAGIVETVTTDAITTIEGNRGPYPAKVRRYTYNRHNVPRLLGYVRLSE